MGIIKFNGVSSNDLGLIVQFIPTYQYPEKEYESVTIPGRNGDLLIDKGHYKNVERSYSLARVYRKGEKFVDIANSIVEWLHSANGYARLEDSYEPDYYREAMFESDGEMANYYNEATALDVKFICKPQRWLKVGEEAIDFINSTPNRIVEVTNPTNFPAKPIIKFRTTVGSVIIHFGPNIDIIIAGGLPNNAEIVFDCETLDCYSGTTYHNSKVTLSSETIEISGKQTIDISISGATSAQIIPRWWTL